MKKNTSIKLKAAFLLMVFALNTIVGFACSVGVDMGFNSKHHYHDEETTETVVHIHKDGKQHVHEEKKESHGHDKFHHHEEVNNTHKTESGKDDCRNDKVRSFAQLDKSVPDSINIIHPVFFTAFLASFYKINLLHGSDVFIDTRHFIRSYHPPIPDIQKAIQSFQI